MMGLDDKTFAHYHHHRRELHYHNHCRRHHYHNYYHSVQIMVTEQRLEATISDISHKKIAFAHHQ